MSTAAPRLLFVEDDADQAALVSEWLREQGYRVSVAHDVPVARWLAEHERLDGAVLNMPLGNETSIPLAKRLRQLGIPVGFATKSRTRFVAGFWRSPVLVKPYTLSQLQTFVERLLCRGPISGARSQRPLTPAG